MEYSIEIKNISKRFRQGKHQIHAIRNLSLKIKKGEIFGLLGPNGAGKSTLLNIITTIITQDSGTVTLLDKNHQKEKSVLQRMSLASGDARFHWVLRVRDILKFYSIAYGLSRQEREKRISELSKFFGITGIMERRFDGLSTGERMRLVFAKSLLNNPEILLLDEPTLGLDPDIAIKIRSEILRMNKEIGMTILLTSHYMHEVEQLCSRIAFIRKGKIVDLGTAVDIKKKYGNLEKYFVKMVQEDETEQD